MTIRNSASRVLAVALADCLPGMQILGVGEALGGIYCDFSFLSPISPDILPQLEERIRQIAREKREVKLLDMVPFSASELLKRHGQLERAEQILDSEDLVQVVQIGDFFDWSEGAHVRHTAEVGMIRLLEKKVLEKHVYRVFGFVGLNKKELKELIGRWEAFPERDHERAGYEQRLWERVGDDRVWLPRGLGVRRRFIDFLTHCFSPIALEMEGNLEAQYRYAESKGKGAFMSILPFWEEFPGERGLLDDKEGFELQLRSFNNLEVDCTSFLQTIYQCLTMLGFTFRIQSSLCRRKRSVLKHALFSLQWDVDEKKGQDEPIVEFLVEDSLGCEWPVATVFEEPKAPQLVATLGVERSLALLLEQGEAVFPFWLAPEHLRVLPVGALCIEAALQESLFFEERGFRVHTILSAEESLTNRIRQARTEKVPFLAIIGAREVESGLISLRRSDGTQEMVTREQLLMLLEGVDEIENK